MWTLRTVFVLFCFQVADFFDPACVIELECAECLPEHMPLVTSHGGGNGSGGVVVRAGEEVTFSCGAGHFLLYPLEGTIRAVCERERYRVVRDRALRPLLDLGCQENVFEDVLHQVEHCGSPLQGRAYQTRETSGSHARHLATLCFDADRALATWLHATNAPRLRMPPHSDAAAPLSILGNFNHMFDANTRRDAERLYSDDARLNRRLRELFKHERFCFAEQTLTSGKLLSASYFEERHARVAEFASNRIASWRSIVRGNLHHVHRDVGELMKRTRGTTELEVFAGTHGVLAPNAAEVFLQAGRRFPVPRYIWTAVYSRAENRGLAVVVLNDPFVTVSEIRAAVFCESSCGSAGWLTRLQRHRNYERPVAGLVFCCALPDFAERVAEMPRVFNATVRPLY